MRSVAYAIVNCDACGASADMTRLTDASKLWDQPNPAGWYGGGRMPWQIRDPFGSVFSDICPACMALPFGQLIECIMKRAEALAGGNSD
jgi:hypothetical protein